MIVIARHLPRFTAIKAGMGDKIISPSMGRLHSHAMHLAISIGTASIHALLRNQRLSHLLILNRSVNHCKGG